MASRDSHVANMTQHLERFNGAMDALEVKALEAKLHPPAMYKAEMGKLRQQSKLAIDKLDELRAAGEDSWEHLIAGTERARDAFTHSFHYFKSQL